MNVLVFPGYYYALFIVLFSLFQLNGGTVQSKASPAAFKEHPAKRLLVNVSQRLTTPSQEELRFLLVEDIRVYTLLTYYEKANIALKVTVHETDNPDEITAAEEARVLARKYLLQRLQEYENYVTHAQENFGRPSIYLLGIEEYLAPVYTASPDQLLSTEEITIMQELIKDDVCMQKFATLMQQAYIAHKLIGALSWDTIDEQCLPHYIQSGDINLRKMGLVLLYFALHTGHHSIFWLLLNTHEYRQELLLDDPELIAILVNANHGCANFSYGSKENYWPQKFKDTQQVLIDLWQALINSKKSD